MVYMERNKISVLVVIDEDEVVTLSSTESSPVVSGILGMRTF